MDAQMRRKAAETVERAKITDEQGIVVQEGFATSRARTFDDTVGMAVPGASLFIRGAQRIVLVTDRCMHLFQGHRFDRPGMRLASYPLGERVIAFDGDKVTFPDGQSVFLTSYQTQVLAQAAALDPYAATAEEILEKTGISGERAITAEAGIDPSTSRKTFRTRVADVIVGDLDDAIAGSGFKESDGRIVLVTDSHVHVLEGDRLSRPGPLLSSFPVGPDTVTRDEQTLILPDGSSVEFRGTNNLARLLAAAAG